MKHMTTNQNPTSNDNWAVTLRYAPAGPGPGNRRHPAPEDFRRRTVVGPAAISTIEAVLDLLKVSKFLRTRIRAAPLVRNFVECKIIPDEVYPAHTGSGCYVSAAPDAQYEEWSIDFRYVSQTITKACLPNGDSK